MTVQNTVSLNPSADSLSFGFWNRKISVRRRMSAKMKQQIPLKIKINLVKEREVSKSC